MTSCGTVTGQKLNFGRSLVSVYRNQLLPENKLIKEKYWYSLSDETRHHPHGPQIFNILLTSNRTGATVPVYTIIITIIIIQHLYSAMGSYWDTEALVAPVKTAFEFNLGLGFRFVASADGRAGAVFRLTRYSCTEDCASMTNYFAVSDALVRPLSAFEVKDLSCTDSEIIATDSSMLLKVIDFVPSKKFMSIAISEQL